MSSNLPAPRATGNELHRAEVADSVVTARAGDIILFDGKGRTVSRRRLQLGNGVVLAGYAGLALLALPLWPALGAALAVGGGIGVGINVLWQRRLIRWTAMVDSPDATRAVLEIEHRLARGTSAGLRYSLLMLRADALWSLGKLEDALSAFTELVAELERGKPARLVHMYYLARHSRCCLLALAGRHDEAELCRPTSSPGDTELFRLRDVFSRLLLGFCSDSDRHLPTAEELHAQGVECLNSNILGATLVLVAWATERRGDSDLAAHWLSEAGSRMREDRFRLSLPPVYDWWQKRVAGLEAAGDDDEL